MLLVNMAGSWESRSALSLVKCSWSSLEDRGIPYAVPFWPVLGTSCTSESTPVRTLVFSYDTWDAVSHTVPDTGHSSCLLYSSSLVQSAWNTKEKSFKDYLSYNLFLLFIKYSPTSLL